MQRRTVGGGQIWFLLSPPGDNMVSPRSAGFKGDTSTHSWNQGKGRCGIEFSSWAGQSPLGWDTLLRLPGWGKNLRVQFYRRHYRRVAGHQSYVREQTGSSNVFNPIMDKNTIFWILLTKIGVIFKNNDCPFSIYFIQKHKQLRRIYLFTCTLYMHCSFLFIYIYLYISYITQWLVHKVDLCVL